MKKMILICSVFALISCANKSNEKTELQTAQQTEDSNNQINYKTYNNERFGYSVDYPDFLEPQGEAGNEDGQQFISEDKIIKMSVYHAFKMNIETGDTPTIQEALQEEENNSDSDLSIEKKEIQDNFYILSGHNEADYFFKKYTTLINDEYYTIFFQCDDERKEQITEIFEYVIKSFKKL